MYNSVVRPYNQFLDARDREIIREVCPYSDVFLDFLLFLFCKSNHVIERCVVFRQNCFLLNSLFSFISLNESLEKKVSLDYLAMFLKRNWLESKKSDDC